jgi:hypothetical protein
MWLIHSRMKRVYLNPPKVREWVLPVMSPQWANKMLPIQVEIITLATSRQINNPQIPTISLKWRQWFSPQLLSIIPHLACLVSFNSHQWISSNLTLVWIITLSYTTKSLNIIIQVVMLTHHIVIKFNLAFKECSSKILHVIALF